MKYLAYFLGYYGIVLKILTLIFIFILTYGYNHTFSLDYLLFAIVYLKCGGKYSILSGIVSVSLVFMVVGDLAGALFMSQSFLLGIVCAYFMNKDSMLMEDIFFSSIMYFLNSS